VADSNFKAERLLELLSSCRQDSEFDGDKNLGPAKSGGDNFIFCQFLVKTIDILNSFEGAICLEQITM
jgi:hypothetical protein